MIEPPPIVFSEWVPWHERGRLKTADGQPSMGVYLWARFEHSQRPTGRPYPELPVELIYVGETNDLNDRPLGAGGQRHHRLRHYATRFPKDHGYRYLYISVFHVHRFRRRDKHCNALRAFTRYVEDLVYWEYTRRFDERPALDYKTGKEPWLFPDKFGD